LIYLKIQKFLRIINFKTGHMMNRDALIRELNKKTDTSWDIIVIGGGATGLGIALDAATRGYKTLLLEQSDFSKGTSSRSTKLVHGGVRYMAQGDLFLVMEALHERGLLLKNAPHLTFNQEFVIPVYTYWDVLLYVTGLKFYDLLAGRLSMGKSYFIGRKKIKDRLPLLKTEGLKGGIVYHDGQFDDSRLALALAKSAVAAGATVLNYFKVTELLKDDHGKVKGLKAKDMSSATEYILSANLVVNATGVFADEIVRMDNPLSKPTIKPSQGVHVVLDKSFLQSNSAIMIPKTDDGRVLFAIPWYDKVVAGTTDTPVDDITMEPVALDEEITFILNTAGKYLTRPPRREDILSVFAGLRPLAANPDNPTSTKEVSRRHKITISDSGLLSIIGGKWTTYRLMAEETLNKAIRAGFLQKRSCVTKNFRLTTIERFNLSDRLHIYGDRFNEIAAMIVENPELATPLDVRLPYTRAEILWICRNEMPVTLEDLLSRRTRSLLLDASASIDMAVEAARLMAGELGFDAGWQQEQLEAYYLLAKNYL
jgi:glycerol-3-phosphate dehydrogenase